MLLSDLKEDKEQHRILSKHGLNPKDNMDLAYYASSFDFPDEDDKETEIQDESDIHDLLFLPAQIEIDDESFVRVTKEGEIVEEGEWNEIVSWLRNNFRNLSGRYYIEDTRGSVLHSFRIT